MEKDDKNSDSEAIEGYLLKQGQKGVVLKGWKRRYFSLRKDRLYYYRSDKDGEAISYIPLQAVTDITTFPMSLGLKLKKLEGCAFQLHSDKRTFYLLAESQNEMQDWVRALTSAKNFYSQNKTKATYSMYLEKFQDEENNEENDIDEDLDTLVISSKVDKAQNSKKNLKQTEIKKPNMRKAENLEETGPTMAKMAIENLNPAVNNSAPSTSVVNSTRNSSISNSTTSPIINTITNNVTAPKNNESDLKQPLDKKLQEGIQKKEKKRNFKHCSKSNKSR